MRVHECREQANILKATPTVLRILVLKNWRSILVDDLVIVASFVLTGLGAKFKALKSTICNGNPFNKKLPSSIKLFRISHIPDTSHMAHREDCRDKCNIQY